MSFTHPRFGLITNDDAPRVAPAEVILVATGRRAVTDAERQEFEGVRKSVEEYSRPIISYNGRWYRFKRIEMEDAGPLADRPIVTLAEPTQCSPSA